MTQLSGHLAALQFCPRNKQLLFSGAEEYLLERCFGWNSMPETERDEKCA